MIPRLGFHVLTPDFPFLQVVCYYAVDVFAVGGAYHFFGAFTRIGNSVSESYFHVAKCLERHFGKIGCKREGSRPSLGKTVGEKKVDS